jgi:hypothetical protein
MQGAGVMGTGRSLDRTAAPMFRIREMQVGGE